MKAKLASVSGLVERHGVVMSMQQYLCHTFAALPGGDLADKFRPGNRAWGDLLWLQPFDAHLPWVKGA